jgi:hypothetical protein
VAAFPQDISQANRFVDKYQFKPSQIVSDPSDGLEVLATPTLILVGTDGKVKKAWIGELNANQEDQVIASLRD